MREIPICKKCGEELSFNGYASFGGDHSNYYKCHSCGKVVRIWDSQLRHYEEKPRERKF